MTTIGATAVGVTAVKNDLKLDNTGVEGSNPRGLKCDNRKGYIGGWIYPEYLWCG